MEYLQQAEDEIRHRWFEKHTVKSIRGKDGFQRIVWGEKGTRMYQVEYVLSGNMIFVTGDLGDAAYQLTCEATLDNIKGFDLHYFTGKLTAHERYRWNFDDSKARDEIEECFFEWSGASHFDDFSEEENELYEELISATREWNLQEHFSSYVSGIYFHQNNVDWFDGEMASIIANCGKRLPNSFIAYWLGLQMVIEHLERQNEKSA